MNQGPRTVLDWVALAFRVFLGGFYVVAGAVKIPDPGRFAEAVANYRLLPYEWVNFVGITLPWVELVAGLLLVSGIWFRASSFIINCLTIVFIGAITSAVARGLDVECGCFGTVGGRQVGLMAIAEDVGLLAGGIWIVWRQRKEEAARFSAEVALPSPSQG